MKSTPAAVDATLPSLLEKILASGEKSIIRCPSTDRVSRLSEKLWNYKNEAFLPHSTAKDDMVLHQPIYLTNEDENANQANILVLVSGAEWHGDIQEFSKVVPVDEVNSSF